MRCNTPVAVHPGLVGPTVPPLDMSHGTPWPPKASNEISASRICKTHHINMYITMLNAGAHDTYYGRVHKDSDVRCSVDYLLPMLPVSMGQVLPASSE